MRNHRGFTLLEIIIAMGIAALIMASVMGALASTDSSRMGAFSNEFIRTIRYAYNQAALTNTYYRIQMDLTEQSYVLEYSDTPFYIVREDDEIELIRKTNEEKNNSGVDADEAAATAGAAAGTGEFSETEDEFLELKPIPSGIRIAGMQTQHQKQEQEEGKAFLYFFPRGRTEFAVIHLSDDEGEEMLTLAVNPLTANVDVMDEYLEFDEVLEKVSKE